MTFTWTPPPEDQRNGELTGYQIDCDNGMGSTPSDSGIAGSGRTVDITGFTPANNYTCSIRATTAIGPGPYTTISVITCEWDYLCLVVCVNMYMVSMALYVDQ